MYPTKKEWYFSYVAYTESAKKTPPHIHSCCNRSLLPISTKLLHTLTYIAEMKFVAGQVDIYFFREVMDIFVKNMEYKK